MTVVNTGVDGVLLGVVNHFLMMEVELMVLLVVVEAGSGVRMISG